MNVLEHLSQKVLVPLHVGGLDISISNGVITLWLSAALVFFFFFLSSRRLKMVPGRLQNGMEAILLFIRDEVASQIEEDRERWVPFLTAIFTFILMSNLLGLIPDMSGATANINTTAALALIIFLVVQCTGIVKHGLIGHLKTFIPAGVPIFIALLLIPVEMVSQLARPFSLAVRLFANMFAGHAVMLLIISMIFIFKSYLVVPLSVAGNAVFLAFEIFIAFIQAFIFTYLSAFYIASAQEGGH
jgi:F-type H+-transporting ATPase subunit a